MAIGSLSRRAFGTRAAASPREPSARERFYRRFMLALRDPEEMLARRRIAVSYEMIRYWTLMFGPTVAANFSHRKLSPLNRRGVTAPTGVLRD
jgi:hypothetical protein